MLSGFKSSQGLSSGARRSVQGEMSIGQPPEKYTQRGEPSGEAVLIYKKDTRPIRRQGVDGLLWLTVYEIKLKT